MLMRSFLPTLTTLSVGVAFTALALSGCAENVKDVRNEGVEQYRGRQYIESMATLRYALAKNPNDAESNYYMGLNYRALAERRFREGDLPAAKRTLDDAIVYFTQAIKTWPNYMAAIQAKNEALESRGKYDAALTVAETQAGNNRGIADHFVYLGDEYRERADYDNALRAYQTALSLDPNNAVAHTNLGKLYAQAGNQELALESFRRAREVEQSRNVPAEAIVKSPAGSQEDEIASPTAPKAPEPQPTRIYSNK